MNAHPQSFNVETYLSEGQARRQRLMRPPNAICTQKAIPAPKPIERPPVRPLWQIQAVSFDAHILAWVSSNNFSQVAPCQAHMRQRCEELGITFEDLIGKKRTHPLVDHRQLIIWEIKTLVKPSITFPELGRMFGGRDHTTCLWALRKISTQKAMGLLP